jgi:FixJ family two-component response regulator
MPDSDSPTVFVVDDDPSVLRSLTALLRGRGYRVEAFPSAADFLESCDPERPGCVIADLRMPQINGFGLQGQLKQRGVGLPVIFLSAHGDVPAAVHAMRQGALAFLEKSAETGELLAQVEEAITVDAARRAGEARERDRTRRLAALSPREREVMDLIVEGAANKEIAHRLGISVKTVEIHRGRVMAKVEAGSVADLVRLALGADPDAADPPGPSD